MLARNLTAIVAKVIDNQEIVKAMQYLDLSEQLGFAAVLLGCQLTADDLPGIPNNDVAKDFVVLSINPVKDQINVLYTALAERQYKDGKWQWICLETPTIKNACFTYSEYMKYSVNGYYRY